MPFYDAAKYGSEEVKVLLVLNKHGLKVDIAESKIREHFIRFVVRIFDLRCFNKRTLITVSMRNIIFFLSFDLRTTID